MMEWRDRKAYDYASTLTRLAWAWEFLRRNPYYRAAWTGRHDTEVVKRRIRDGVRVATLERPSKAAQGWALLSF